jgi:hypothetical protein
VEYDVLSEAHVEPQLLMAWKLHLVRDYQVSHVIAFAGEKRLTQIRQSEVMPRYAPQDLVTGDPNAPPAVARAIERDRRGAALLRSNGRFDHLFVQTAAEESRSVFDGAKCFVSNDGSRGRLVEAPPESFQSPIMYLAGLGLRPRDPRPRDSLKKVQAGYWFPDNFAGYANSRLLPREEFVDGAACVVVEATREEERDGKHVKWTERIWFDPELGYAPRKWELLEDGVLSWVRTHVRFEEFSPGCWLPLESTWTRCPPQWVAAEFRGKPAYSYNMRLRRAKVNDVRDDLFGPEKR